MFTFLMNKNIIVDNNNNMSDKEYELLIKETIKNNNIFLNIIIAFVSGGFIGLFGELLNDFFINNLGFNNSDSGILVFTFFVVIGSVLTGLGVFDKVLSICKCGLIVPSTGFANTMTSSAMDNNREGFVKGIGSNIFKLTGSIILYGVVFGIIFGFIRSII